MQRILLSIEERNKVIKELYNDPGVRRAVIGTMVKIGATEKKAEDLLTDSIVNFVKACYKPGFAIKSSLKNYLITTAKNIYLKEVTKNKIEISTNDMSGDASYDDSIEIHLIADEKKRLLMQLLDKLDDTCRQVLMLWATNKRMKEIAQKMTYKSEGMARKKKHQCLQKLYGVVAANPGIKSQLSAL